ncbi:MAG: VWA domain-containing protein [Chthoniobacteraceae bacterium]
MNFLWPLAWGLGALALPVIAFYLIRTRLQRKPVSTLLFWEHLTPQVYNHSLWRKLRRWVSLALQLLFLLLLILAIAQPLAAWQTAKPAAVILVLDTSVTMTAADAAPSRWEAALQTVRGRVAHLRLFDEAILVAAGEAPRVLCPWTRSQPALERALKTAAPGGTVSDMRGALALAHHLAAQRKNSEILLVSDGVWEPEPAPDALKDVHFQWVGAKEPVNAGITLFTARRSLAAPGEYQVIGRVAASTPVEAELEVRADGALIDVQKLKLEPGKPWRKTWEGSASGAVRFEARLTEMKRDDLAADNAAQASLPALHPVPVEVVAPPHAFLDAALEALPLVETRRTWPLAALPASPDPARLYLFYGCVPPEGFQPSAMLVINPQADGPWGKYDGPLDSALVSETLRDEPILRFVSLDNVRLDKVSGYTPAPGATLFAQYLAGESGGHAEKPLLFGQWKAEAPRWLVQAFGLEDSDFVYRTAFPVLLANLVQSLQPEETEKAPPLPGPVATQLKRALGIEASASVPSEAPARSGWLAGAGSLPVWWWALVAGALWLPLEWALFHRRITE